MKMAKTLPFLALAGSLLSSGIAADEKGAHLFILSGQSNMQGHRPEEAFTPAVNKALGKDRVIVIQDAQGGQPIQRWDKQWTSPSGEKPEKTGDLYDRLMANVEPAIEGRELASVTFLWMQGERDARMEWASVYEASLKRVVSQLEKDLERKDIHLVIGRLSDFDLENKRYPHWTKIREIQVSIAESDSRVDWVNTDDLNDGKIRQGKDIENDLHYSAEGYKVLGERFAEQALKLIRINAE